MQVKRSFNFWSQAQIDDFRRLYPHNRTADIVDVIGHSVSTMHKKAIQLGIKKTAEYAYFDKWTVSEDQLLRDLYPTSSQEILVGILERSASSIRVRAHYLGITKTKGFKSAQKSESAIRQHGGRKLRIQIDSWLRDLLSDMEYKIEVLNAVGQTALANLTSKIIERIKAKEVNLDFLTIRDER